MIKFNMIHKKLRELRILANLTQKDLAKKLNITERSLSHYENGTREINTELIKQICIYFDISADELLEIETEEQRKKIDINNSFNNNSGKINIKF